jgi:hypothetical protein
MRCPSLASQSVSLPPTPTPPSLCGIGQVESVVNDYVHIKDTKDVVGAMSATFTEGAASRERDTRAHVSPPCVDCRRRCAGVADHSLFQFEDLDVNTNRGRDQSGDEGSDSDASGIGTGKGRAGKNAKGKGKTKGKTKTKAKAKAKPRGKAASEKKPKAAAAAKRPAKVTVSCGCTRVAAV